jgi:ribosome-binding factor A
MKNRLVRVAEIIKRELSGIIARELEFDVPLVTVHSVDLTPDLKNAHVFVSGIGTDAELGRAVRALDEARIVIQAALAKRVVIKQTPHLYFHIDRSVERGSRVLAIMNELGLETAPSVPDMDDEDLPPDSFR